MHKITIVHPLAICVDDSVDQMYLVYWMEKNVAKIVLWSYVFDAYQTFHAMHMTQHKNYQTSSNKSLECNKQSSLAIATLALPFFSRRHGVDLCYATSKQKQKQPKNIAKSRY